MYFIYGQDLMTGLAPLRLLPKIRGSTERQMEKNGKHTKKEITNIINNKGKDQN